MNLKNISLLLFFVFIAWFLLNPPKISFIPEPAQEVPVENGSIEVHFCPENCFSRYMELINASSEIKCAFYDLDEKKLINLLKEKDAEVIIDEKNYAGFGKKIKPRALMHNKFCILDGSKVITGSLNPTERGFFKNNNNFLLIKSKFVAKNYLQEFNELENGISGKGSKEPYPKVYIREENKTFLVENYFCPEDDCEDKVAGSLSEAGSVYFMTFSFTSKPLASLLVEKSKNSLVEGVMETTQAKGKYSAFPLFQKNNLSVSLDKNKYNMHNKVFILDPSTDKSILITGSYNPTWSADKRNDENILIIHNKEITEKYFEEYEQINAL